MSEALSSFALANSVAVLDGAAGAAVSSAFGEPRGLLPYSYLYNFLSNSKT